MQATLMYITEYETAQQWERNPQYDKLQVLQQLQIIYGKADKVKQQIDTALNNDDIHRRRRVMHPLGLPQRFPEPQTMKNCSTSIYSTSTWIAWIRENNNDLIAAIDEENARRRDPDDPFDGTEGGIFAPLQHKDEPHNTSGLQWCDNGPQIDESENGNIQNENAQEGRLVDILNTNPTTPRYSRMNDNSKNHTKSSTSATETSNEQQLDISTSRPVREIQTKRGETDGNADQLSMNPKTDRPVEESCDQEAQNPPTQNRDEDAEQQRIHSGH